MHVRPLQNRSFCTAPPGRLPAWTCLICLWTAVVAGQGPPASGARPEAAPESPAPVTVVPGDDIPPYHFSLLQFTGTVTPDGKLARLTAEIDVHINQASGWYDVPLRLNQAAVRSIQYEGPRAPIPAQPAGPDDGVHWLFQGAGKHHLSLELDVELRSSSAGTNLQLALPSGPRFLLTQLSLTVPVADLIVEVGKDNTLRSVESSAGKTVIQTTVQGSRVDLTWRAVQPRAGAIARVSTSLALDRHLDDLRLQAVQDIVTDGQIVSARVRLPQGFRLVSVGGPGYLSHAASPSAPGWVDVQLGASERTGVQLQWQLVSERPLQGGEWTVSGFEVEGAIRQTGTVGVAPLPGYGVRRQIADFDDVVEREEPRRLRSTGGVSFFQSAWRFDRQPFELHLVLQEQRPAFDVRTRALATTADDRLLLELDYAVQVHAGLVQELLLRWPAPGVEAWTLIPPEGGLIVRDATDEASSFPGELQRIRLPEPRDGQFNVRLRFERPLTPGRFELALPQIVSERSLPAWLVLRGTGAVSPQLDPSAGVSPLNDPDAVEWLQQVQFVADHDRAFRLAEGAQSLAGFAQAQPREFSGRSTTRVTRAGRDRWRVEQRIDAELKYGRLSMLSLEWPASFPAAARALGAAAVDCRTVAGDRLSVAESAAQLTLAWPRELQGPFSFVIAYSLPASTPDGSGIAPLDVPLFTLSEAPFVSSIVEFPQSADLQISAADDRWTPIPSALEPSWSAQVSRSVFPARLTFDVAGAPQRQLVEFSLGRVAFDLAGRSRLRVDYWLEQPYPTCVLRLPSDASAPKFSWNGLPLPAAQMTRQPTGQRWDVPLPSPGLTPGNGGWLRVEYQRLDPQPLDSFQELSVALPSWPDAVTVSESFVEIGIPAEYCLWTFPQGLAPLFSWQPGLVFQRQPTAAYLARRGELIARTSAAAGLPAEPPFFSASGASQVYPFWGAGPAATLTVRIVRLWMLILLGAGLTLALAFLLWTIPVTRDVLTPLVLGFLLALAGVFAAEEVELLLQPVLLGLLAAAAAIGWQTRGPLPAPRRPRRREEHSTRSEHPRSAERSLSPPPGPTTQSLPRDLLETGTRP